ncbi:hypothetical protein T439DRAFT_287526 [Meredithblackwellia eburnea MCA 4105]
MAPRRGTSLKKTLSKVSSAGSVGAGVEDGLGGGGKKGEQGTAAAGGATRQQRPHDPNRPNFSYSALIGQAILSVPEKRLRLAEIYEYVTDHYAYYKKNECGWQNSIRHNLSLQPVFKKVPDVAMPGKKGCFWTIIPGEEWRFANGGWLKMDHSSSSTSASTSAPSHGGAGAGGKSGHGGGASVGKGKAGPGGGGAKSGGGGGGGVKRKVREEEMEMTREEQEEEKKLDQLQDELVKAAVAAGKEVSDDE